MPSARSCCSCAANALTLSESNAARKWVVCSRRSLRLRAQEPPPLEVDPIVPRNQGGSDDISNLQSLCIRCNAAKRWEAGCEFCALEGSGRVPLENELALCIADAYAVTPEHSLVIPRRHGADGLALHQPEWNAAVELIAERMLMNDVVKRFIGAEFNDIQCLTTNAFRFSSIRTWASNSRFSSGRTRSSRAVRSRLPTLPVATIKSLAGVPRKR